MTAPKRKEQIKTNQAAGIGAERRQHLRVMDAIGLEILHESGDKLAASTHVSRATKAHNRYDLDGYSVVQRDFPAIVEYIDLLEEQIRQLQLDGRSVTDSPTHTVILSAGGVAFADDQLFQPGDILSLRLTLFPQRKRIECDGAIVSIGDITELARDTQHSYRVTFTSIAEQDVQAIDQHVHRLYSSIRTYPE